MTCVFHHIAGKPRATEFYEIWRNWHTRSTQWHNHVCQILVNRFRGYGLLTLQKYHFPLTSCVTLTTVYALLCDTDWLNGALYIVDAVCGSVIKICCLSGLKIMWSACLWSEGSAHACYAGQWKYEMHVLDHYASISDQSQFAHVASHNVKWLLL